MQTKRILSIEFTRTDDTDTDTSYLGTYGAGTDIPLPEFSIDRTHELDCGLNLGGEECTCNMQHLAPGEYQFFNPSSIEPFNPAASWIPAAEPDKHAYWQRTMRENARKDYERMEAYNASEWSFIGIRAVAHIVIRHPSSDLWISQTITSGGLWGIESDSDESYLRSVEKEQLGELRGILHELGFSTRAIAATVKAM